MTTKYYSMREVAMMLGISRPYVYYLKAVGKLRAYKVGAQWIIPESEVNRIKKERNGDNGR